MNHFQRLNALGAGGGNLRTAISSEPTRKLAGNKLPIIEKTQSERSILEKTLISNAFMRNLNKEQLHKVRITPSCGRITHQWWVIMKMSTSNYNGSAYWCYGKEKCCQRYWNYSWGYGWNSHVHSWKGSSSSLQRSRGWKRVCLRSRWR